MSSILLPLAVFIALELHVFTSGEDAVGKALLTCFALMICAVLFTLYVYILGLHIPIGEGQYTGYVTAVETTGIFQTKRAYFKTELSSSNEDMLCVIDENVFAQLKEASKSKANVTINYASYVSAGVTTCSGEGAFVTSF